MQKLAVVTRANDKITEMIKLTHPILQAYALKCGAEFKVLSDSEYHHPHWRILRFWDIFETYDRILSIDTDVLIQPNCPNLFEIVPENMIGSVLEDKGTRQLNRRGRIESIQEKLGNVKWSEGYINTGVFVVSKQHRDIFKVPIGADLTQIGDDLGQDDIFLGHQIHRLGHLVQELPFQFNHMTMFSEEWNNNASRFDSYIIHYAGNGRFNPNCKDRLDNMKQDALLIYGGFNVNNH